MATYLGPEGTQPVSRFDHNRELLRRGELGLIAEAAYVAAARHDPRLESGVEIVTDVGRRSSFARAVPAWASMETNMHRMYLPTHSSRVRPALEALLGQIRAIPGALEHYAGKMSVRAGEITPEGIYAFTELHELGHVADYHDNHRSQRAFVERDRAEKLALPIADVAVSALMDRGSRHHFRLQRQWPEVAARLGVDSLEAIYGKQHEAYRSMTAERHADDFAAAVIAEHPELALGAPAPKPIKSVELQGIIVVGDEGLEPPTSSLSVTRSNQLS